MEDFLELSVSAIAAGCVYGLIALSYLMMLRPTGIINFAVGEWAMVGAFGGFLLLSKFQWNYGLGMAALLAFMLVIGWATERISVRPLTHAGAPLLAPILALLGMLVVFRESISLAFGPDPVPVPYALGMGRLEFGLLAGSFQNFFIIGVTVLVFAAAWWFFERTLSGKCFEAVALDRRAAALMGINLARVGSLSFAAGAAAAGLAGVISAPNSSAHFLMGIPLAIQGFTALVVGGVGKVHGALLGGLLIAFAEQLTIRYAPIPAGYAQGVPLLLLMIFLLVKPEGLLGAKATPA